MATEHLLAKYIRVVGNNRLPGTVPHALRLGSTLSGPVAVNFGGQRWVSVCPVFGLYGQIRLGR